MKFSNRWKTVLGGLAGAGALAGILTGGGGKKPPAGPSAADLAAWTQACKDIYVQELQREADPGGLEACVEAARVGADDAQLRANLRASDEYKALQERLKDPPPTPVAAILPVRVDGRFFVTSAGTFRPLFASGLTLLVRDAAARAAFLKETRSLGFNGIRVFAGALPWAGQTPEGARAALPGLLDEAAAQGLYVFVSALTETRTGYDAEAHLRAIAGIVQAHPNALLEIANEPTHPTQSDQVNDPARLLALARRAVPAGVLYALGAAAEDEPDPEGVYAFAGGAFNTAHLDRGRDKWNQVRRLREIEAVSAATKTPTFSGEPIGADERMGGATGTKQRRNDPEFFFALGALSRGFELPTVFHSEAGLQAQLLGPTQRACAEAFVAGWRALDTTDRLQFMNATWAGSPVESANFDRVVRAYSFVAGNRGWTVLVGLSGDPAIRWGSGWRPVGVVAERPGVQVLAIAR